MTKLDPGLYERLITEALHRELEGLEGAVSPDRQPLRSAEAGDRLAIHLGALVQKVVDRFPEKERIARGVALTRALVDALAAESKHDLSSESPIETGEVLRAIRRCQPDGSIEEIAAPSIPLLDSTLLTNAPGEPGLGHQINSEIASADGIDIVMAFIRMSGIRRFKEALRTHCEQGRPLRVLTTTYTGSTECAALEFLQNLGAEVRVSYDIKSTRLHAKAWLFHRGRGISTAYVGSSNLTHSAQVTGLEWNVRASSARNPDIIDKIAAVFDSYWERGDFEPFVKEEFELRSTQGKSGSPHLLSPVEIRLEPFQSRLLEEIEVARERGQHRNLLVSATGTGKTVMAAMDYATLRSRMKRSRLLFVAHREEILKQSIATYRHALRDHDFGDLWVGGQRPTAWEHVFASIQSVSGSGLADLERDHFDIVVVDEFHHAAATSYKRLLDHVNPVELLGLTATPERADGLPILDWFDGRISAELRLWDAIDQQRLVPFEYYGIHDGVDLREVEWKRGRGYDVDGLTNLYTADDARARLVLQQLSKRVSDLSSTRALGFCVSIEHARFMARVFSELGVPATAVWGDSPKEDRSAALRDLQDGKITVLFSVDLFNEGVDLPNVNTLLFLRPTDSATLFLQQLGRGLRQSPDKDSCLVLDFVSLHRSEFRFDRRLRALLGGSRKQVERQVEASFPFLPAGCHMELEPVARDIVLRSIRNALPTQWRAKAAELRQLLQDGEGSLAGYLEHTGLDLSDLYPSGRCWSDLQEEAGIELAPAGPEERKARRAIGRLLHIDDPTRLRGYIDLLARESAPTVESASERERRVLRMLIAQVFDQVLSKDSKLAEGIALLWKHPQVRNELNELFAYLLGRVDHQHFELASHPDVPLRVHAKYTRLEILAAFQRADLAKVHSWQTGVYWMADERADLFAFTLDKTSGEFSPTTRYKDYAISPTLIHWESQSVTRADSATGLRYRHHQGQGSSVMLFARERQDDRAFWFLGPATYRSHIGELPMAITWRLKHALPGDLFASFAAAVA